LNDLLKDTVQLKANELYNLNDQLTASTSYELNDKLINKIRLKKILGLSITNAEYTQITELANECINELGDAVINAHCY
jgi:galactokinase/mevalonate kinase-like predicted kinase